MNFAELLPGLLKGLANFTLGNAVMITAALILICLAVFKEIEPVLLLPIGFGCLLANIPLAGITATEFPCCFLYVKLILLSIGFYVYGFRQKR